MPPSGQPLRIGISMRVANAVGYDEPRDALAHDWPVFMRAALPGARWLPIPNLGADCGAYLQDWALDGFILSGGNDIGDAPLRDQTEHAILDHAAATDKKVLGICRGLQLMINRAGGTIIRDDSAKHVAKDHAVRVAANPFGYAEIPALTVNSYHDNLITNPGTMVPFAFDQDGHVEAAFSGDERCAAVMWHPERARPAADQDIRFIRQFFTERS